MKLLSSMEWRREYPVRCLQKKIFASLWSLVTQVVLVFTIFLSQQYFKREKENIPFTVFRMQVGVKQQFTNNATTKRMLERPWANRISENVLIDLNGFVYNSFSQIILQPSNHQPKMIKLFLLGKIFLDFTSIHFLRRRSPLCNRRYTLRCESNTAICCKLKSEGKIHLKIKSHNTRTAPVATS